jgi:hypothetical protein
MSKNELETQNGSKQTGRDWRQLENRETSPMRRPMPLMRFNLLQSGTGDPQPDRESGALRKVKAA